VIVVGGIVDRLLEDDAYGSRHQRFILRVTSGPWKEHDRPGPPDAKTENHIGPNGRTILISHNIDVAPRLDGLSPGDAVRVRGKYKWNDLGGVMHWTHHAPEEGGEDGWIEYDGKRYG